jgi:hypothetical protein
MGRFLRRERRQNLSYSAPPAPAVTHILRSQRAPCLHEVRRAAEAGYGIDVMLTQIGLRKRKRCLVQRRHSLCGDGRRSSGVDGGIRDQHREGGRADVYNEPQCDSDERTQRRAWIRGDLVAGETLRNIAVVVVKLWPAVDPTFQVVNVDAAT